MAKQQRALGFAEDPRFAQVLSPKGSGPWAEWMRSKLQEAVDLEARGAIDFSCEMDRFIEASGWRALLNANSRPFSSWREFALHKRPHGLGCDESRLARLNAAIEQSVADRAKEATPAAADEQVRAAKAEGGKKAGKGRPIGGADAAPPVRPTRPTGDSSERLTARIARDRPDVLERMKAGEFPSVRAAAREAGIVKPITPEKKVANACKRADDPVALLTPAVSKLARAQLTELRGLIDRLLAAAE